MLYSQFPREFRTKFIEYFYIEYWLSGCNSGDSLLHILSHNSQLIMSQERFICL